MKKLINTALIYVVCWGIIALYVFALLNPASLVAATIAGVVWIDVAITLFGTMVAIPIIIYARKYAGVLREKAVRDNKPFEYNAIMSTPWYAYITTTISWVGIYLVILLGFVIPAVIMVICSIAVIFTKVCVKSDWRTSSDREFDSNVNSILKEQNV